MIDDEEDIKFNVIEDVDSYEEQLRSLDKDIEIDEDDPYNELRF